MSGPNILHLILDAGPMISNTKLPPARSYYTTLAVLNELKDDSVRQRLQSLYELDIRNPQSSSINFVRSFAKQTGDLSVLSAADIGLIALTYELECEANNGDWRLRKTPGQARINGSAPSIHIKDAVVPSTDEAILSIDEAKVAPKDEKPSDSPIGHQQDVSVDAVLSSHLQHTHLDSESQPAEPHTQASDIIPATSVSEQLDVGSETSDDDSDWITPSNVKHHQEKDRNTDGISQDTKMLKVACASHDYALQNVMLQIGLNLVSGDGKRISSVKTWLLRCHACFKISQRADLKFCPSCGGATLMRTSVSTDSKGQQKIHLKRNMQWNNRGTVYSIPKQQHGTSNMKGRGNLILRADQREVEKIEKREKYRKEHDLLDPDYVPSIVSGRRGPEQSSVKVGHGKRNINSNKKR